MSRSHKKYPGGGIAVSASEKHDKQIWHRRMRHRDNIICHEACYADEEALEELECSQVREVSNTWDMSKDGKVYHGRYNPDDGFLSWVDGKWHTFWDNAYEHYRSILGK